MATTAFTVRDGGDSATRHLPSRLHTLQHSQAHTSPRDTLPEAARPCSLPRTLCTAQGSRRLQGPNTTYASPGRSSQSPWSARHTGTLGLPRPGGTLSWSASCPTTLTHSPSPCRAENRSCLFSLPRQHIRQHRARPRVSPCGLNAKKPPVYSDSPGSKRNTQPNSSSSRFRIRDVQRNPAACFCKYSLTGTHCTFLLSCCLRACVHATNNLGPRSYKRARGPQALLSGLFQKRPVTFILGHP